MRHLSLSLSLSLSMHMTLWLRLYCRRNEDSFCRSQASNSSRKSMGLMKLLLLLLLRRLLWQLLCEILLLYLWTFGS